MHAEEPKDTRYGMIAEFDTPDALIHAAAAAKAAGYKKVDAYSPFPVHGLSDAIGFHENKVPWIVFIGGLLGGTFGYSLQYYVNVFDYPMNVGGKPLNSMPSFIPVTFECTILFASLSAFLSVLALNMLPQPYHPIFNAPGFERASQDRFFLSILVKDPLFDTDETQKFLEGLNPLNVAMVEE